MVFQDSYASLNPRLTIEDTIAFGPKVHGRSADEARARAHDLLRKVGLDPAVFADRYPHELSGGQRQRVNIARALALAPRLVLLDEAVSALDKSVEAQVLNLLLDLKDDLGLTYVFISHDLNVVRFISDRVIVMYLGEVVEQAPVDVLWQDARHPYTRALLAAMPSLDPDQSHQGGADRRRPAEPDRSAVRLPLPHPLSVRRAGVQRQEAVLDSDRQRPPHRRLPHGRSGVGPQPGRPFIRYGGSTCLTTLPPSVSQPSPQRRACRSRRDRRRASRARSAPTVARFAAENVDIALETEPSTFVVGAAEGDRPVNDSAELTLNGSRGGDPAAASCRPSS